MSTLWQKLRSKASAPVPTSEPVPAATRPSATTLPVPNNGNPLGLNVGDTLHIKTIDLEDYTFTVDSIREVKREVNNSIHRYADYRITGRAVAYPGQTVEKLLRLIPTPNPDAELTHDVLLLNYVSGFAEDAGYVTSLSENLTAQEPVLDKTGNATVDANGQQIMDTFERINKVSTPWDTTTKTTKKSADTGRISITPGEMQYWDFWRDAQDADGNQIAEFYWVELDQTNHYMDIWRGEKIDTNRIKVL